MMGSLIPAPLLSVALFIAWLLLNTPSIGISLLGAVLAMGIPLLLGRRRTTVWSSSRALTALRLACTVLLDIVVSAIGLARLILGPEARIRPGFFLVPLTLRDPHGVVLLASIITLTPGTLTVDIGVERDHLLVHAFDLDDGEVAAATIKLRYEAPLLRIYEGAGE